MASLEEIYANLKLTETKKYTLQKAMLSLLVKWKDLDAHLDFTHQSLEDKFAEMESKEKDLLSLQESLAERNSQLDLRLKFAESKEMELQAFHQQLSLKEKQLDSVKESLEERIKEVESREDRLLLEIKPRSDKIDSLVREELETFRKQLDNYFTLRQQQLDSDEESLKERIKKVKMWEDISLKQQQLNSDEECLEERIKEVVSREDKLHSAQKRFQTVQESLERHSYNIDSQLQEVRVEETPFNHTLEFNMPAEIVDGKFLRKLINQYAQRFNVGKDTIDVMSEVISKALRLSSDPAKLVLDAVEGLNTWETEFERSVVWMCCVLLLENLIALSPKIKTHVKDEALIIASEWIAKVGEKLDDGSWEALSFLHLVAAYDLTPDFTVDELLNILEIVATHEKTPILFRHFGLTYKVPVIIRKLIEKEQHLQAIRYVFEFKLVDSFPPVPLLKAHLTYSEAFAKKVCHEGHNSTTAQELARKVELNSLIAVVKCITDYRLQLQYSPEKLRARIKKLQEETSERSHVSLVQHSNNNDCHTPYLPMFLMANSYLIIMFAFVRFNLLRVPYL